MEKKRRLLEDDGPRNLDSKSHLEEKNRRTRWNECERSIFCRLRQRLLWRQSRPASNEERGTKNIVWPDEPILAASGSDQEAGKIWSPRGALFSKNETTWLWIAMTELSTAIPRLAIEGLRGMAVDNSCSKHHVKTWQKRTSLPQSVT